MVHMSREEAWVMDVCRSYPWKPLFKLLRLAVS